MKYLVTGHNGFIGAALYKKLQNSFGLMNVVGYDDNTYSLGIQSFLYHQKPDVIFHVGACSDTQENDINKMMHLNFLTTNIISEYCRFNRAQLIYSSSAACYGTEGFPNTLYGWSKYAAEKLTEAIGGVSLRYFNVYGHNEGHKGKMASVAYQAYQKNEFLLFPNKPKRDFVYIDDVVSANIHALENYVYLSGGVYDVGTGVSRKFEEVLDLLGVMYSYHRKSKIPQNYQFNTCANKLKFMKDWYPKYQLEKGMEEYIKILSSSSDNTHTAS
jgi:ADP-L-glycero-D-manno-heptose 6-epimerase